MRAFGDGPHNFEPWSSDDTNRSKVDRKGDGLHRTQRLALRPFGFHCIHLCIGVSVEARGSPNTTSRSEQSQSSDRNSH
ncbi:hypothetical protein TNCV_4068261 [Trichonephila clavipes]|nr:hypothetical protein TNCV_4068261 [Trichonephila clavipes]